MPASVSAAEEFQADRTNAWPPPGAGATPTPPRLPQYPLKTARTLHSDSEIKQARENVARYPDARTRQSEILRAADGWLRWSDADLARLVTPASVPRAFDVGASVGCPRCGQTIHEKFGTYPWLVDLHKPFRLTCPVDGSVYPDNDYQTYWESGFTKKTGWDKPVVDDGWGWLNPKNNERYWFVAHYNHNVWHRHIGPGLDNLGSAYLLMGKKEYAHKAAVLLWHIAQVYPAMDHEKQSRYGLLSAARGIRYSGKVLNHIWETALATGFARAYDAVWETLDSDSALQSASQMEGHALRSFIEANLLEEILRGYEKGQIVGNFGMHQNTVAHTVVVRQHGDSDRWIGGLLDGRNAPGKEPAYLGISYALYNLIFRDGMPSESSPGYNSLWLSKLNDIARLLQKGGRDLWVNEPRLRLMYEAIIAQNNARVFVPDWGDSGSVWGDKTTGHSADVFLTAARAYEEPAFARFVAKGDTGDVPFPTFETLFLPPASSASRGDAKSAVGRIPRPSRLLDGGGLGILCNLADTVSSTLTYGWKAGHGHYDRLSFELWAGEVPLMPDLGYPDAMNDYVSGIYTWSKNTVAHNTVVVDKARQTGNVPGTVRLLAQSPFARVLDVDARGTYKQATDYRRALLMVDGDDHQSYFLDVFHVVGGQQHDYVLHGPPGPYAPQTPTQWGVPQTGTLAGPNVPLGQIYDDATLGAPGYKGGFNGYVGSGFQHLFNVRRQKNGTSDSSVAPGYVEWRHEKKPAVRLRVRVLPQAGQELILAEAFSSPVKKEGRIGYLLARRNGTRELSSRFVSVIEPITTDALEIEAVRAVPLASGEGVAVEVRRAGGSVDLLIYDPTASKKRVVWNPGGGTNEEMVVTDAQTVVLTRTGAKDEKPRLSRVFVAGLPTGCDLAVGEQKWTATGFRAAVSEVFPGESRIRITGSTGTLPTQGAIVHLANASRTAPTAYTVAHAIADQNGLTLTMQEGMLVGRAPLKAVQDAAVSVDLPLPLAATYPGAAVYAPSPDPKRSARPFGIIASAQSEGVLHLTSKPGDLPPVGTDVWMAHAAPGDTVEMPSVFVQTMG